MTDDGVGEVIQRMQERKSLHPGLGGHSERWCCWSSWSGTAGRKLGVFSQSWASEGAGEATGSKVRWGGVPRLLPSLPLSIPHSVPLPGQTQEVSSAEIQSWWSVRVNLSADRPRTGIEHAAEEPVKKHPWETESILSTCQFLWEAVPDSCRLSNAFSCL